MRPKYPVQAPELLAPPPDPAPTRAPAPVHLDPAPATAPPPRPDTAAPDLAAGRPDPRGPFRAAQVRPGDPYELSHGHPIFCSPSGGRASVAHLLGGAVVAWDPAVREAGVDTGYSPAPEQLRAPHVAVGNVPESPGWVAGAPALAIEYADLGEDEASLAQKIHDLLAAGTRWVWVVRLEAPRHVEVHAPGAPPRRALPGELLHAPGVLQNPLQVEALYERAAAQQATLTNLLQREGHASLESLRDRGLREGRKEGLQQAVRDVCDVLGITLSPSDEASLIELDGTALAALLERLKRERRWPLP
ncbi:Uma2 family endonuclease [Sorangium sp. So ce590]|uniref:Uma2 family endonuclease n=1 Tax=Sorangium sp. So ce590 TaxID=3133317 RepID=UPI003F63D21F